MPITRNQSKSIAVAPPSADLSDYSDCSDLGENWDNAELGDDDNFVNENWLIQESDAESGSNLQTNLVKKKKSKKNVAKKRKWESEDLDQINFNTTSTFEDDPIQFSDISLDYFLRFFDYEVIDTIIYQSNLYHILKKGTSLKLTRDEFLKYLG